MCKFFLVLCLGLTLWSCKKKKHDTRQPDHIIYTDIKDDTLENLRGQDMTIIHWFDINQDNINDFSFSLRTYLCPYTGTPHSGPCTSHFTNVLIDTDNILSKECSVKFSSNPPQISSIGKGLVIDSSTGIYKYKRNYLYNNDGRDFYYSISGDIYIGVYLESKYFGWIRVEGFGDYSSKIIIKEMAINMTEGNSIVAGQKQ